MFLKSSDLAINLVIKFLHVAIFFAAIFDLNAQTSPTVTLVDTDTDNLLSASDTVTIRAIFREAMVATSTISITGAVTSIYMYIKDGVSSYISNANFSATSSGTHQ